MSEPTDTGPADELFFASPRPRPRYEGVSDPVKLTVTHEVAEHYQRQAIQRAYLQWATSPDREHWMPAEVSLQVVDSHADFFVRGLVIFAATVRAAPILTAAEIEHADQLHPGEVFLDVAGSPICRLCGLRPVFHPGSSGSGGRFCSGCLRTCEQEASTNPLHHCPIDRWIALTKIGNHVTSEPTPPEENV